MRPENIIKINEAYTKQQAETDKMIRQHLEQLKRESLPVVERYFLAEAEINDLLGTI